MKPRPDPRKRRPQKQEPSRKLCEKRAQKEFASSLNWIGKMYGQKLTGRIAGLTPKLGLFLRVDRPGGRLVVSMFSKNTNYHISIETNSVLVETLKLEGPDLTRQDIAQMQHKVEQIGKKELARQLAEKTKNTPLPETTKKEYPFERGNSISIGKALQFALMETLDALEKEA